MRQRQNGFAIIEVLLIIVILCIIAFVAWRVIEAQGDIDSQHPADSTVIDNKDTQVPEAKNAEDLDSLDKQMDDAGIDDATLNELDKQTF